MRITVPQRRFLDKFRAKTYVYATGSEIRVANSLDNLGLVRVHSVAAGICSYRLSEAGEAWLRENKPC